MHTTGGVGEFANRHKKMNTVLSAQHRHVEQRVILRRVNLAHPIWLRTTKRNSQNSQEAKSTFAQWSEADECNFLQLKFWFRHFSIKFCHLEKQIKHNVEMTLD